MFELKVYTWLSIVTSICSIEKSFFVRLRKACRVQTELRQPVPGQDRMLYSKSMSDIADSVYPADQCHEAQRQPL